MHLYDWLWFILLFAVYAVPFAIGLAVSTWGKAVFLAGASFAGFYLSIWSALGPLFLPFADRLVTRFELVGMVVASFGAGILQAAVMATAGFATRRLFAKVARHRKRPFAERGFEDRLSPRTR